MSLEQRELDGAAGEEESLRDALMSAYSETDDAPAAKAAPVEKTPPVAAPKTPSNGTSQVRGPNGQFTAKPAEAAAAIESGTDEPTGSDAATAVVRNPPASWTPELKDTWSTLSPAIQDYVLKRERDFSTGIQEKSERLKSFEEKARDRSELDRILTPYRERWALNGIADHQQIQKLLAAQDLLNRNPAEGIRYLANEFRLNPAQIFAAAQNQQPGQPSQLDSALSRQVADLTRRLEAREAEEAARAKQVQDEQNTAVQTEIEAFKADPANKHFETLKTRMSVLLGNGEATSLADAYEQAAASHPSTRQQYLDEQFAARANAAAGNETSEAKAKAEAAKVAAAKVAKAKAAAVSVKGGSPSGAVSGAPKASLRDELEAQWDDS